MKDRAAFSATSQSPSSRLHVGPQFNGDLKVHGSWNTIDVHGGNVSIGGDDASTKAKLGLSLSDPLPPASFCHGDLIILVGMGARQVAIEAKSERTRKKRPK
jgi:hypothetical protein